MEYNYPKFTPEMKKTHKVLIPNMAVTQFRLLQYALQYEGYNCEVLGNCGSAVAQLGLKYVHNDTCYPALLVIGQFLDALNSGKYDLEHTALLITQTGGGCRASNYIHLLRKALVKAGYPQVPGGQPELLRPGEGQRLPDDAALDSAVPWPAYCMAICCAPCATRPPRMRTSRALPTAWWTCGWSGWAVCCWQARALPPGR